MPVNFMNQIVQDHDGYLWFSSMDGLVRYDGYDFEVYTSARTEGLYSNRIGGMFLSSQNELWLLHEDGSISRKSGNHFTSFEGVLGDFNDNLGIITEDPAGEIWITTYNGISHFDSQAQRFEAIESPLFQSRSWGIQALMDGSVLAVNSEGLIQWKNDQATLLLPESDFNFDESIVVRIKQFEPGSIWVLGIGGMYKFSLSDRRITESYGRQDAIFMDLIPESDQSYLVNTSRGFFQLNPVRGEFTQIPPDLFSRAEYRVRRNLVFQGKNGESIRIGDDNVLINGKSILQAEGIKSSLIDKEGTLWITTVHDGIFQIRKSIFTNITPEFVSGLRNVYPIIQSFDGAIWAGSFINGVYKLSDEGVFNWTAENSQLPNGIIRFLYEDADGIIYAGSWASGLWKYSDGDWERIQELDPLIDFDATVEAMYRDSKGRLFIGSHDPLVVRQNGEYSFFDATAGEELQKVRTIREDSEGTLYLGTMGNGLTIISDKSVKNLKADNGFLNSDFIRDVYVQSKDTIWIANENMGLNRLVFDDHKSIISSASVTVEDGLMQNSLHRIIESPDHYLWISSNGGIMRISKEELNHYADGLIDGLTVTGFTEEDGMSNREANGGVQTAGVLSADDKLWFPTQDGITVVDPARITQQDALPLPIPVIEAISFSDSLINVSRQSEIQLPSDERNLQISFSAPNYYSPERIKFRYKLDALNRDWEDGSRIRQAVFTNIPPGTHEFQLQVFREGNPSEITEATLFITIPTFFYETTWFMMLLGVFGALIIFGGIKYRTRVLEERERKLQERVDQQTVALQKAAEQKSRFFSGITHELKTPLSLIVSPLEDILDGPQQIPVAETRENLQLMHRNSHQLKNLVDQILDVTKLNSEAVRLTLRPVNITEFSCQVIGQFQSKLDWERITLVFESNDIEESIYLDTGAWERILINLMSNAIRFSPPGASVYVSLEEAQDSVRFIVKDEGPGIDEKDVEKVFDYLYQAEGQKAAEGTGIGLYLVKGLIDHMGGTIQLKSKKGEGAEFIITLKKGYRHFKETNTIVHDAFINTPANVKHADSNKNGLQKPAPENQEHILLVEDNYDYRNYLQSLISDHYQVSSASDGKEALILLQQNKIDLIISDIMMPRMNGLEFVNTLRKQETYKHLPVIFLSAKNRETDMEAGLSTGADIYLTKPIKSSLLLSQIVAVLRREKILNNLRDDPAELEEDAFVKQVKEIIYRQLANPNLNVNMLADTLYMSRTTLYREWKKVSDINLKDFIKEIRLTEAKVLLEKKGFSVQETALAVGYPDVSYFSIWFKKEAGRNPSVLKK